MIQIIETHMTGRRELIATVATFADAKRTVETTMTVVYMEDDADHTDCADAYTSDGRVIAIQPEGFKL